MTPRFLELPQWAEAHKQIETCPWAGPRPLRHQRDTDARQFVGRDRDRTGFLNDVLMSSVVVLSAESGVGKTSMLEMALRPELEEKGYTVFYCDQWTIIDPAGFGVDDYFAQYFSAPVDTGDVVEASDEEAPDATFAGWLDREHSDGAVLILDQFEELMRYSPQLFERFVDWIADVSANRVFKVVVSLRSEYLHRLRDLESKVGPWQMSRYVLEPVRDLAEIRELILSANLDDRDEIRPEAVDALIELWSRPTPAAAPPGLLELHALLYSLYWERWEQRHDQVDETIVDRFVQEAAPLDPFAKALNKSVRWKLDLCELAMAFGANEDPSRDGEQADLWPYYQQLQTGYDDFASLLLEGGTSEGAGLPADIYLVNGTRGVVEKLVRHLSSGGYKLVREEWELCERTLERELGLLSAPGGQVDQLLGEEQVERLFRRIGAVARDGGPRDLLTVGWEELLPADVLDEVLDLDQTWDADPDHLSCSAMLGMHPLLVLIEEMRRLHFGIQWLRLSDLIRITSPSANQTMVSLIHDGFGPALDNWSRSRDRPLNRLTRITASKGETFDWLRSDGKLWPSFDAQTIVNIRWHDCNIRAHFRQVAFVNCDFRGCRFENCVFEGALFLNCLLDGATVNDSLVVGGVNPFDDENPRGIPPSFEVPLRRHEVEVLSRYRTVGAGLRADVNGSLISHTSGMPALPFDDSHRAVFGAELADGQPWRVAWRPEDGGLAMYGGRLCSLMMSRTRFADGGTIALRLVSGSGLDLVEHIGGTLRLDVYGSAIRGLTITGVEGQTTSIDVRSLSALLVNTWLGDGLEGRADFVDNELWQLINLNPADALAATLEDCGYHGVVNVSTPSEGSIDLSSVYQMSGIAQLDEAARLGARMDYESDPAKVEYERRLVQTDPPCEVWPRTTTLGR